jgi:hypothetical protein
VAINHFHPSLIYAGAVIKPIAFYATELAMALEC